MNREPQKSKPKNEPGAEIQTKREQPQIPDSYYYELEELVAGITPENRHEEWDIGPPVGKEIW